MSIYTLGLHSIQTLDFLNGMRVEFSNRHWVKLALKSSYSSSAEILSISE